MRPQPCVRWVYTLHARTYVLYNLTYNPPVPHTANPASRPLTDHSTTTHRTYPIFYIHRLTSPDVHESCNGIRKKEEKTRQTKPREKKAGADKIPKVQYLGKGSHRYLSVCQLGVRDTAASAPQEITVKHDIHRYNISETAEMCTLQH